MQNKNIEFQNLCNDRLFVKNGSELPLQQNKKRNFTSLQMTKKKKNRSPPLMGNSMESINKYYVPLPLLSF